METRHRPVAGAVPVVPFDDHRQAPADGDEFDLRGGQPGQRTQDVAIAGTLSDMIWARPE